MRDARYCFDFDVWSTDSFRLSEWNSGSVSVWGFVLGSFSVSERSPVLF